MEQRPRGARAFAARLLGRPACPTQERGLFLPPFAAAVGPDLEARGATAPSEAPPSGQGRGRSAEPLGARRTGSHGRAQAAASGTTPQGTRRHALCECFGVRSHLPHLALLAQGVRASEEIRGEHLPSLGSSPLAYAATPEADLVHGQSFGVGQAAYETPPRRCSGASQQRKRSSRTHFMDTTTRDGPPPETSP